LPESKRAARFFIEAFRNEKDESDLYLGM